MPGHLAPEQRALRAHTRLEERVPHAVDVSGAPGVRDGVGDRAGGAHVVEDRLVGLVRQQRLRQQRGEEVAVHEAPGVVDEEAAVGIPVPRNPEVGAAGGARSTIAPPVLWQQRIGLVVGEAAVGTQYVSISSSPSPSSSGPTIGPAIPLPPSTTTFSGRAATIVSGSTKLERGLLELGVDVHLLDGAADAGEQARSPGWWASFHSLEAGLDQSADVLDAGVAGERERALAHELRAGVRLRVVRGGAHQPAVEPAGADEVVEHLGRDLSGVEHVHALGEQAVAVAGRELRRRQAHVVPQPDAQLGDRLALQLGEDPRERAPDQLGDVAVDLLTVDAADVVGLEDLRWRGPQHSPSYALAAAPRLRAVGGRRRGAREARIERPHAEARSIPRHVRTLQVVEHQAQEGDRRLPPRGGVHQARAGRHRRCARGRGGPRLERCPGERGPQGQSGVDAEGQHRARDRQGHGRGRRRRGVWRP